MSIANFIPELWSARALFALRNSHVFPNLMTTEYEGEIARVGDTVHIQTPAAITVGAYSGTVTYQTPTSSQQDLLIDQDVYFAFEVDDAERIQANINLIDTYLNQAMYNLADNVDVNISALYASAGNTVALDISSVYTGVRTALVDCGKHLDEANVPQQGRWLTVSPTVMKGIRLASDYTPASELGDDMKVRGSVGMLEGFNIFMSNNVTVATQHKCLAGYNGAWAFAGQLLEVEAIRRDAAFKDAIRGRFVFGRKVIRSGGLVLLNVTV